LLKRIIRLIFAARFWGAITRLKSANVDQTSYKTVSANKANADKQWLMYDAEGQTLGRLASDIAMKLRGKHKTNFTPHADCGDYVIVINAEKVTLSGNKWDQKEYIHHTGYPGGQRSRIARDVMAKKPTEMVEKAVRGMLPKNTLGREIFRNLYVYAGNEHKHEAQQPKEVKLNA
jgi:large subunit ribosomal protein L13